MNKQYSFELFPPKTDAGMKKMQETVNALNALGPAYFSVTYGAGGSTQDRTFATVDFLRSENIETAPHLSCIGATRQTIADILEHYRQQNITKVVALRGDMPSGMGEAGDFRYANELVQFIREQSGDHFHIEVAAYPETHPQANNALEDLAHFRRKIESGADGAITQYFYNVDAYRYFVDAAQAMNIDVPITPGVMPITNYSSLARFSDACGAEIPRWLRKRLEGYADDIESIRAFGIEFCTEMCQRLLDSGAPGLHFYTMNHSSASAAIWRNLGLPAAE